MSVGNQLCLLWELKLGKQCPALLTWGRHRWVGCSPILDPSGAPPGRDVGDSEGPAALGCCWAPCSAEEPHGAAQAFAPGVGHAPHWVSGTRGVNGADGLCPALPPAGPLALPSHS